MKCFSSRRDFFFNAQFPKTVQNYPRGFAFLFLFLLLVIGPAAAQSTSSHQEFRSRAAALIGDFESAYGAKVGVSTLVLKSQKVPYSYNGTKPMVPASNLKVLTTAAGLEKLGPNFRFKTELLGPATEKNGVLDGDIILKCGGDPTFFPPAVTDSLAPFETFAQTLKDGGIREVTGNLVIDDSDFDREYISDTYHDRYLLDDYAAPVGGLSLNRNQVTLNVSTDGVTTKPASGSLKFVNKVEPGSSNQIWVERARGTDTVTVHGYVRSGETAQTTITVGDPVRFAASAFFRVLRDAGIKISKWEMVPEGQSARLKGPMVVLARHLSPPLSDLVRHTNVDSDNLLAQHIFRRLGAQRSRGTVANSEAAIKAFLETHKIDSSGLTMLDGSGLSDQNRVSPHLLVRTLRAMWDHQHGQTFIDSLAAPGEGTMRRRLGGKVVRAKTGTLNDHSGLTGYVVTAYGETVGFSILVNDISQVWRAVELQDHLVLMLANWDKPL